MAFKFANKIIDEIKARGSTETPVGSVSGEEFEEWLCTERKKKMTREEAIVFLKEYTQTNFSERCRDAHEMAIKALEQEPCEDAVSRKAVTEFLRNHAKDFEDVKFRMTFMAASSLVENTNYIPSVTPTRKKGKWIRHEERKPLKYGYELIIKGKCSNCGEVFGETYKMNYCPNCGSFMRGEED